MAFQLFPSFSFDESDVGPRPVRTASVDRIGFVGVFSRGPVGPRIVDARQAENLFGFDAEVGSAHLQAAIDQGAADFAIVRAMPTAKAGTLTARITGPATAAGNITVTLDDAGAPVNLVVAVGNAETAASIVSKIVAAVQAATHAVNARVGSTTDRVEFYARTAGLPASPETVQFTLGAGLAGVTVSDADGAAFGVSAKPLVGGVAGPAAAQCVVSDAAGTPVQTLDFELVFPGAKGNDLVGTITAGSEANLFDIVLTLTGTNIAEVYRDVDMTDVYDEDKLAAFAASNLVRVRKRALGGVPAPATLTFTGGNDGDPAGPATEDFVAAIDKLRDVQCTIIICPGLKPNGVDQAAINEALITQAEKADTDMAEASGLRVAVLSTPRTTTVEQLPGLKSGNYIPDSKRVVMVMGWGTSARVRKFKRFGIDPAAPYAGHLMVTPIAISPAARTSSPVVRGLTEVDTPVGNPAYNEITRHRLEALHVDPVIGGIRCLNGRSTSSDPAWYWICIRRVYDRVRTDIFFNFQFIKSEPSSKAMDDVIEKGVNAYLTNLMNSRVIAGFNPAISNDSNNDAATRANGIRYVNFAIELYYPNDYVQFNISRTLRGSVRLV